MPLRLEGWFALELGDDRLLLHVSSAGCRVIRLQTPEANDGVRAALRCETPTLRALVFAGLPMDAALRDGALALSGDTAAVRQLLQAFPRPSAHAR